MDHQELATGSAARQARFQDLLAIHSAVFLFGLSGFLGKWLPTPAAVIVFSRAILAAVFLGAIVWLGAGWPMMTRRQALGLAGSGALLAVHWLTFFHAIQLSTVAIGLLSFSSFPLFTTLLEPWLLREPLRGLDLLACVVVVAGLALVTPDFDLGNHLTQGAAWGVVSGLSFAVLSIVNRKWVRDLSPLTIGTAQNAVAAVCILPFAAWSMTRLSVTEVVLLLILGILCTALAHVIFIRGLRSVRAREASIITGLEPVYAILLAWGVLHETPPARTLLGGALILGAVGLGACQKTSSHTSPPT